MLNSLHRVVAGHPLAASEAEDVMEAILRGEATPAQIAGLLVALKMKGETAAELVGFARAMRRHAVFPAAEAGALGPLCDTCGTGGDGRGTINVSTIAAFAVAGAGARVAKHGNRAVSSRFGSGDLFEALGVRMPMTAPDCLRALRECGLAFLYAPAAHPAMRHAALARQELKMRTAFNLLGPLTNPAGAQYQVVGAPSPAAAALLAEALAQLGVQGFVVHGSDGLDEITTTGPTCVWTIGGDSFTVTPETFGVPRATLASLTGDPLQAAESVLRGEPGPWRDIVIVNAAAALKAVGRAGTWMEGIEQAAHSLDSGAAWRTLEKLRNA
jgi:anthranilate phosphoribosyltransferase